MAQQSAESGTTNVPSVAHQDSTDSPIDTKDSPAGKEAVDNNRDFSRQAQDVARLKSGDGRYAKTTPQFHALAVMAIIAGRYDYFERVYCDRQGYVNYFGEITPQLLALAQAPPSREWDVRLNEAQAGAWFALAIKTYPNLRLTVKPGTRAPWAWPPSKDGTIYAGAEAKEPTLSAGSIAEAVERVEQKWRG